jgi:DNA-binding transcriptional LysR family regulator
MDVQQLQLFVSVAQTLNFTRTAENFYMTQPAISHSISMLEKDMGVKLINRSSHEVVLTTAGQAFYEYAIDILDLSRQAQERVSNIAYGKLGLIKIFAVETCINTVIECLAVFSSRYPEIQLDIHTGTGREQLAAIDNNNYDIYFSFESLLQSRQSLDYLPTTTDRYGLFVNKNDASAVDIKDFSTLSHMKLISYAYEDAPFLVKKVVDICEQRGFDTNNRIVSRSFQNLIISVNAGIGFTILPTVISKSCYTQYAKMIPIPGDDTIQTSAVGWNKIITNNAVAKFVDVIGELYKKEYSA